MKFVVNLKNYLDCPDNWSPKIHPILESIESMCIFAALKKELKFDISVDWESFINSSEFTHRNSDTRQNILSSFYENKLTTIQKVISKLNGTEITKKIFADKVKSILFTSRNDNNEQNINASILKDQLIIGVSLEDSTMDEDDLLLQIMKVLDIITPYFIEISNLKLKDAQIEFMKCSSTRLDIEVDWSFTKTQKFKNLSANEMKQLIVETTEFFLKFIDSLSDVYFGVQKLNLKPKKEEDQFEMVDDSNETINSGYTCDYCYTKDFVGRRYKCLDCNGSNDFVLCESCKKRNDHVSNHTFECIGKVPYRKLILSSKVFRDNHKRTESKEFPGFVYLSKNLKKLMISIDLDKKSSSGELKFKNSELKVVLNSIQILNSFDAHWIERLQGIFDLTVPIAAYDSKLLIESIEKRIKFNVDSSFTKSKKFLEKEQHEKFFLIRLVYIKLIENFLKSLHNVVLHPMGKEVIDQKVSNVSIKIDVENSQPKEGSISHNGNTIYIILNLDNLAEIGLINLWKAKIELLFNLLVKITLSEYEPNIKRIEDQLAINLGKRLPLVIDTKFSEYKEFNYKSPHEQHRIIQFLCTTISDSCIGKELMEISKFKSSKIALSNLKQIVITADHLNKQAKEGDFSIQNSILIIKHNMDEIQINSPPKDFYWKIQELLDIVEPIAQEIAFETYSKFKNEINQLMEKEIKIEIDNSFTASNEFKNLDIQTKSKIIQFINSNLLLDVFGNEEGLFRFICLVKKEIQEAFDKILIKIDTTEPLKNDEYQIQFQSKTLISTFKLKNISNQKFEPCGKIIEKLLNLRSKSIESAFQKASNEINELQLKSKIKIPIEINWDCLKNSKEFKETSKYLQMIDNVKNNAKKSIFGSGGVSSTFQETISAINQLKRISFVVDLENTVRKSEGLYTSNYIIEKNSSGVLIIYSNYKNNQTEGCGMNVEFHLTPSLAKSNENQITMKLQKEKEDVKKKEEKRQKEVEEKEKKKEEKKKEELEKKKKEKCMQCKNGSKKCWHCEGTGHIKAFKKACRYCKSGQLQCPSCKGTGLKYPNLK